MRSAWADMDDTCTDDFWADLVPEKRQDIELVDDVLTRWQHLRACVMLPAPQRARVQAWRHDNRALVQC